MFVDCNISSLLKVSLVGRRPIPDLPLLVASRDDRRPSSCLSPPAKRCYVALESANTPLYPYLFLAAYAPRPTALPPTPPARFAFLPTTSLLFLAPSPHRKLALCLLPYNPPQRASGSSGSVVRQAREKSGGAGGVRIGRDACRGWGACRGRSARLDGVQACGGGLCEVDSPRRPGKGMEARRT